MNSSVRCDLTRAIALAAGLAAASCSSAQAPSERTTIRDIKRAATAPSEPIMEFSSEHKHDALARASDALSELDASIGELESAIGRKSQSKSQSMSRTTRQNARDLGRRRNLAAEWYGGLNHSSSDALKRVKQGVVEPYSARVSAWHKTKKEFDDGT